MADEKPEGAIAVANRVSDVASFDPGLGSYSFKDLGQVVKFADLMSKAGEMLPAHLRGKTALCMAVTMRATHWGFDPFALAMETYQAKQGGIIGYQAKVFSAVVQSAGVTLVYEYTGEVTMVDKPVMSAGGKRIAARTATGDRQCRVRILDNEELDYLTPKLDDITIKNSPQWHNDPDQQLAYYAVRGWARRHRSDLLMGAYSDDEVQDMKGMKDVTPDDSPRQTLAQRLGAGTEPDATEAPEPPLDGELVPEHWTESVALDDAFPGAPEWKEGSDAAAAGAEISACPYEGDLERAAHWIAGFSEAKQ